MNLRAVRERKEARRRDAEINVTPVLNVFLIIIPFLLLTAVFVRLAILELALPSLSRRGEGEQRVEARQIVLNLLTIDERGFQLKSSGLEFPPIPMKAANYDYETLAQQLRQVKARYAGSEDVIIAPSENIPYEIIVHVMDVCRENGFPNISISG
ncbi:MAG: biopolymer transporter ExbD [candidate division KSB1 bacterium]|nr:biopolymer transporter ExbD [candidate division KSB1 bacterium]